MKNILINAVFLLWGVIAVAQVIIGGEDGTPNPHAMLEVKSSEKGFLPPRVELQATNQADPLTSFTSAAGITVYNTASAGAGATAVSPGYYYNDGAKWIRLVNDAENGLHTQTGTVKLGGELTENTTIDTDNHDLAITDLDKITVNSRNDLNNQNIVLAHNNTGVLNTVDAKTFALAKNNTVYKAKFKNNVSLLSLSLGSWHAVDFSSADESFHTGAISPVAANGTLTIQESGIYALGYYFRKGTGIDIGLIAIGSGLRIVKNNDNNNPLDFRPFAQIINIVLAQVSVSQGEINSVYKLNEGDTLTFQLNVGVLNLGLLASSEAHIYLYKISDLVD